MTLKGRRVVKPQHNQIHFSRLVAQLDVRPSVDQEVAGSTPTRSATFFHGD